MSIRIVADELRSVVHTAAADLIESNTCDLDGGDPNEDLHEL